MNIVITVNGVKLVGRQGLLMVTFTFVEYIDDYKFEGEAWVEYSNIKVVEESKWEMTGEVHSSIYRERSSGYGDLRTASGPIVEGWYDEKTRRGSIEFEKTSYPM